MTTTVAVAPPLVSRDHCCSPEQSGHGNDGILTTHEAHILQLIIIIHEKFPDKSLCVKSPILNLITDQESNEICSSREIICDPQLRGRCCALTDMDKSLLSLTENRTFFGFRAV